MADTALTAIVNLTMSQRQLDNTKWLCCLLLLSAGPAWSPVASVTVKTPPNTPSTIEAQAKFFQYRHLPTHEDYNQGHRQGNDRHFTERHEHSRPSEGLFSAKVRWGDKQGGYGEHYWDLNHAGHTDNHGHDDYGHDNHEDDGSYSVHDNEDPYDEPSEQSPTYTDEYDAEKDATSKYDESNRAKRHHPRVKETKENQEDVKNIRHKTKDEPSNDETEERPKQKKKLKRHHKPKEIDYEEDPDVKTNVDLGQFSKYNQQQQNHQQQNHPKQNHQQQNHQQQNYQQQNNQQQNQKQQNHQQQHHQHQQTLHPQQQQSHFVPYEGGAGVRHRQAEAVAAASSPRLFLEPSTGHVVDRSTGQAYILQPIVANYN